MGEGQLLQDEQVKAKLWPCPRCDKPYSFVDPSQWHVDPAMCRACRDEVEPFKQTIVFMVGADRCGKTEIGKALSKHLALPYYKASAERGAFVANQKRFINDIKHACPARLDLLKQLGHGVVYDRGYPCEYVYSRFFGRKSDDKAVFWLDEQYARLGANIVIAARKDFTGIQDDLDASIGKEQLERLVALYDEFAAKSKCRILKLFVDDEDLSRELTEITAFIKAGLK